jgi:glyoxylase-like metal-dependent hydrolase (beta-lactamase superfamily II)
MACRSIKPNTLIGRRYLILPPNRAPTTRVILSKLKAICIATTGAGLAVHSGFVLITKEGALVIDPAMTCTATWLRDEIKKRFNVPVKYVVYTHAHADHISGGQVFQQDGAIVVANQRAVEPSSGRRFPRRCRTASSIAT